MKTVLANITINGIVQGVGFRPYIHRQIQRHGLAGWIRNTACGVELEVEGAEAAVDAFLAELPESSPRLAVIESVETRKSGKTKGYTGFRILPSSASTLRRTLISPDICLCDDCRRELFTPGDRRYRYPFINCTNCGPRFTILRDIPYDRANTSMAEFAMCDACAEEYHTIENRRYHAQPDCCPVCGPQLFFLGPDGEAVPGDPVENAVRCLQGAGIVAVKGLGGIHLACLCEDAETVRRLRRRKRRDERPFAVMCRDTETARRYCEISPEEEKLLVSPQRPIVLLKKRGGAALSHISENGYLGVMLPYTPLHELLFASGPDSLVMTSANLSEQPILYRNEEALTALRGIADGFLLHDRDIVTRCDDSLLWVLDGKPYPVRRSRGYVPYPITVRRTGGNILAAGAEQKASFSLLQGNHAFQSQHIGDLKNMETLAAYETQIAHFERLFDIRPERLACDLHPDYLSTAYAEARAAREGLPLLRVQHHHAHLAACMADNRLEGECIGIIWDGTGLGTDGTIWGGEFLAGGYASFVRAATLRTLPLPGGDRAVREPWRLGITLLLDAGAEPEALYGPRDTERIRALLNSGINCPASSSMGRLFDGVSSLLGITHTASYEGQGAILLEAAAEENERLYPYAVIRENGLPRFDYREMIRAILADRLAGVPAGLIAAGFMNTLSAMAAELCALIRGETGLDRVCLSGGTFQNMYLLHRLIPLLAQNGFQVYHHSRVSTNDEGISLGQGMIASEGGSAPCV